MKVSNINYSHKVSYDYYLVKYHHYAHNNGATLGCYDYKHFQPEVIKFYLPHTQNILTAIGATADKHTHKHLAALYINKIKANKNYG